MWTYPYFDSAHNWCMGRNVMWRSRRFSLVVTVRTCRWKQLPQQAYTRLHLPPKIEQFESRTNSTIVTGTSSSTKAAGKFLRVCPSRDFINFIAERHSIQNYDIFVCTAILLCLHFILLLELFKIMKSLAKQNHFFLQFVSMKSLIDFDLRLFVNGALNSIFWCLMFRTLFRTS